MTAYAAIFDNNIETKDNFIHTIEKHWDEYYGGQSNQVKVGQVDCHWRTGPASPVSSFTKGNITCWVLGHIDATGNQNGNHAQLLVNHFEKKGIDKLTLYSGYFLAILFDGTGYHFFTDRLGLFPCYYSQKDEVLVVGSSPDLTRSHQIMTRELNLKGLIGHLLCMHEVLGETLWKGAARLGTGEVLKFDGRSITTHTEQSIPVSDDYFGLPYETHIEMAHETMIHSFKQLKGKEISLLFSGGLDSRMIAGYLNLLNLEPEIVYTLGIPSDLEFRCAEKACRYLKWTHQRVDVDFENFMALANRQVINEQLANGFNDLAFWSLVENVKSPVSPLVNGFIADPILGGSSQHWAYDTKKRAYTFEKFFQGINRWGLSPEIITKLIPDNQTPRVINEIIESLRSLYESLPGYDFQKVYQFFLRHRQRFHIAGIVRRFSKSVWPFMPYTQDSILNLIGGMPAGSLSERKLQRDIMIRKFLPLVQLPVDNNSPSPTPLAPTFSYRVRNRIYQKTHLNKLFSKSTENRYYYRVFDFNNEGWRSLRAEALPCFNQLSNLLDLDTLQVLLPSPDVNVKVKDGIMDTSGRKSLLAFSLWSKYYPDLIK